MSSKSILRLDVEDKKNNHRSFIPVGVVEGAKPGPTLAVFAGVHGTEYASQEGVARVWESLNPAEISGRVFVVLAADVTAVTNHRHYNVINSVDKKNLNRIWPGKRDGTLTEVIAHTLTREVIARSDAVIDCHGGEFDESIDMWLLTHVSGNEALDKKAADLALALGMPFIVVTNLGDAWAGVGLATTEAMKSGRPGITLEVGGRGLREERHVAAIHNSVENALRHMGMKDGRTVSWAGATPIRISRHTSLTSGATGLYTAVATAGTWIEKGKLFGVVRDFDGRVLQEIKAPTSGVALHVIVARAIQEGVTVGSIGAVD